MTHQRSHATPMSRLKAIASAPTSPATVGQVWREHFTPKRYRNGGKDGMDGVMPTCPGKGPDSNPGGMALRIPTETILA